MGVRETSWRIGDLMIAYAYVKQGRIKSHVLEAIEFHDCQSIISVMDPCFQIYATSTIRTFFIAQRRE